MRADQLQLGLRPRPRWEAVDLGVRMTQDAARSLARAYLPFAALLAVACLATVDVAGWLPITLLAFAKPWLERGLLAVFARHAFGEPSRFRDAWAARAAAPWLGLLVSLTIGRLVPWRSLVAPVSQLEGQRGAARRKRLSQLANGHRGGAAMAQFAFALAELAMVLGLMAGVAILTPGVTWAGLGTVLQGKGGLASDLVVSACYAVAMTFLTPFHVASGFAMYLNRRADLEAWDVEQDLREAFAEPPRAAAAMPAGTGDIAPGGTRTEAAA